MTEWMKWMKLRDGKAINDVLPCMKGYCLSVTREHNHLNQIQTFCAADSTSVPLQEVYVFFQVDLPLWGGGVGWGVGAFLKFTVVS